MGPSGVVPACEAAASARPTKSVRTDGPMPVRFASDGRLRKPILGAMTDSAYGKPTSLQSGLMDGAVPPPPRGLGVVRRAGAAPASQPIFSAAPEPAAKSGPRQWELDIAVDDRSERHREANSEEDVGHPFGAELDVAELDERFRPGRAWSARTRRLSRSMMVFASRRMCHMDRLLMFAVHLVDAEPAPLCGRVVGCDYESEGLYRVDVELLPLPDQRSVKAWLADLAGQGKIA